MGVIKSLDIVRCVGALYNRGDSLVSQTCDLVLIQNRSDHNNILELVGVIKGQLGDDLIAINHRHHQV